MPRTRFPRPGSGWLSQRSRNGAPPCPICHQPTEEDICPACWDKYDIDWYRGPPEDGIVYTLNGLPLIDRIPQQRKKTCDGN